jgi:hypothetical protein
MTFFRAGDLLLRVSDVEQVLIHNLKNYQVRVLLYSGKEYVLTGPDAIELVLLLKPSALEGRRLRWVRHAWMVHNLIGHPGMQLLALLGKPRWGLKLHEWTVPCPKA